METTFNESPGRNGFDWVIGVWIIGGDRRPGTKRLETTLFISFSYNHMSYGLCLDKVCCMNPDPTGQVVVEMVTVGGTGPVEYDTG